MTQTLHATFDGQVLRPEEPLALPPNTRVLITVESVEAPKAGSASFLEIAQSLNLEGPPDWSVRIHDYLYGDKVRPDE